MASPRIAVNTAPGSALQSQQMREIIIGVLLRAFGLSTAIALVITVALALL